MGRHRKELAAETLSRLGDRSIVMVGLMGCGKTTVGRRLAQSLRLPFVDADTEIERAARMTIPEIFAEHGEAYFRAGERRVIARLLGERRQVLATGGGAFMDPDTRTAIARAGVSIWLRASLDVLMERVMRRDDRPLLKTADPRAKMQALMDERYPIYAEADLVIDSLDHAHDVVVGEALKKLPGAMAGRAT
ncbi:MAG: shikimate kinase [Pseudomonadota bacterium]